MFFNHLLIVIFYFIFNSYFLKVVVIFSFTKWQKEFLFLFLSPQPPEEFLGFSLGTRPHSRPSLCQLAFLSYIPLAVYAPRLFRNINAAALLLDNVLFVDHGGVHLSFSVCTGCQVSWSCWRHGWG